MKTIEELEMEIAQKSQIIEEGLRRFENNIDRLGQVIGKDPSYVHEVLKSRYEETMDMFSSRMMKNPEILQGYSDTLDKIMDVLDQVLARINMIEESDESTIDEVAGEAGEFLDNLATNVEQVLDEQAGVEVEYDYVRMAIVGVGSYALMKVLGFGNTTSIVTAGVAAYLLGKPGEVEQQTALHSIDA